ncbi:MAG: hypothetical protein ACI8PZ_007483 [Myxococcota bacterium]|jgi:hypothetical protein
MLAVHVSEGTEGGAVYAFDASRPGTFDDAAATLTSPPDWGGVTAAHCGPARCAIAVRSADVAGALDGGVWFYPAALPEGVSALALEDGGAARLLRGGTGDKAGDAVVLLSRGTTDDTLVVGTTAANGVGPNSGVVQILPTEGPYGPEPLTGAPTRWRGEAADDRAGGALAAGDIDGDGVSDLVVGAHQNVGLPGKAHLLTAL